MCVSVQLANNKRVKNKYVFPYRKRISDDTISS